MFCGFAGDVDLIYVFVFVLLAVGLFDLGVGFTSIVC